MADPAVVAAVGNYSQAAILTFVIPIATLVLAVVLGFYNRKPLPDARRVPLFPLAAIPQRRYDLALLSALHARDRQQLIDDHEDSQAGAERPVGGN